MRQILTAALALVLAVGLTACGGKEEKYTTKDVQAMVDAGAFSEKLEEMDAKTAFMLYHLGDCGLSQEDVKECAVLRSAGATCEECAVLVLSSKEKAQSAADGLHTYLDNQIASNEDYRPAEIPKLENAYVNVKGSTVLMAVANDLDAAKKAVD